MNMKIGDTISMNVNTLVPLPWWQKPFARWIKRRYVKRLAEFVVTDTFTTFGDGETVVSDVRPI